MEIQHPIKRWEVSILELKDKHGLKYKVTRIMHFFAVSETKIFNSKEEALIQFNEWLN